MKIRKGHMMSVGYSGATQTYNLNFPHHKKRKSMGRNFAFGVDSTEQRAEIINEGAKFLTDFLNEGRVAVKYNVDSASWGVNKNGDFVSVHYTIIEQLTPNDAD